MNNCQSKRCPECKSEKPVDQFDKGRAQCKICRKAYNAQRYKENPQHWTYDKEASHQHYERNKEAKIAAQKVRYQRNKVAILAKYKIDYQKKKAAKKQLEQEKNNNTNENNKIST